MIDKINNNRIPDVLRDAVAKSQNCPRSSDDANADVLLQVSHEALIDKAQQPPAEDETAVERARQLLLSGQLDSPENIRKAAENILKFGV